MEARAKDLLVRAREGYYASPVDAWPQPRLRITGVDPSNATAGDLVTASGNGLDRSNIEALYLTDGARTMPVAVLEQTATGIKFKIPDEAAGRVWSAQEMRPHYWTLVLQTPNRNLLDCVGFRIAID